MSLDPTSKVAIIGGTSGIGLATARRAAERGARVVLCSCNESELQETVDQIGRSGGTAHAVVADVSSPDDTERLAAAAVMAGRSMRERKL